MNMLKRIGVILTDPHAFFKHIQREQGIRNALIYLAILMIVSVGLGTAMSIIMQPFTIDLVSWFTGIQVPAEEAAMPAMTLVIHALIGYVMAVLIGGFFWAGIVHVWCLLFGGKAGYSKSYQLSVYASTPGMLFGWVPFVSIVAQIWGLILLIIGTQHVHGIARKKAILMWVIPVIVLVLLWVLAMLFFFTFVQTMPPEAFLQ
jgi:hypothetical protein